MKKLPLNDEINVVKSKHSRKGIHHRARILLEKFL